MKSKDANDKDLVFSKITEDPKCHFQLQTESNELIPVDIPITLDPAFEDKEFDVFILVKKDLNENDIFQVFDRLSNSRIGWCIPVQALSSNEHDYSENVHFLKYAYIAVRDILSESNLSEFKERIDLELDTVRISNIFHPRTAILVICRETLSGSRAFELDRAIPSLMKYGYLKRTSSAPNEIVFTGDAPNDHKLYLRMVSPELNDCALIANLYCKLFAFESKPEFKFFYIYQLLEYLLGEVLRVEQDKVVKKIIAANEGGGNMRGALEEMQNIVSEKARMKALLNHYTKVSVAASQSLRDSCNDLMRAIDMESRGNCLEHFYVVRNSLFHGFWRFPESELARLSVITHEALDVFEELFSSYEKPKSDEAE